ncbi:hypothetical protein MKX01_026130 [Papaver californicum]|nr:hypothetical protein MKX01_026130 [Papaver californicum]
MEFNGIVHSLENKIIFVTGSTGYLSKLFVEKLLRVQPNVKHLFLLLRPVDALSPTQRLHKDVIGKEIFRVLRKQHGLGFDSFVSKKVTPIFGDISLENMGIKDSDLEQKLHKEINFISHFAAATNFQERYLLTSSFGVARHKLRIYMALTLFCYLMIRYDVALAVNTVGAKNVLSFAKKCENLETFLHVSTAFVCLRDTPGVKFETPISQTFEELSKTLDIIEEEKMLVQQRLDELKAEQAPKKQETAAMIKLGLERAKLYGWPNTYVFTKALGELEIGRHLKRNIPIVIVRPTAVTGTYKEPFPGWIEGFKSVDPLVISVGRGKLPCFIGNHESFFDMIPGDMVVNAIIVAMVNHTKSIFSHDDGDIIYHIGNSKHREPTKIVQLLEYAYEYFCKNPWMGGGTYEIVRPVFFPTMSSFEEHICNNYVDSRKQEVQFLKRLAEIFEPYVFSKTTFDTSATDRLRMWTNAYYGPGETDIFDFDPKHINWKDYMVNVHVPGLIKYVVKPHVGYNSKL